MVAIKIMLPELLVDKLKLATALLALLLYVRHFLDSDAERCKVLLSEDAGGYSISDFRQGGAKVFQPTGCMFHNYTTKDLNKCLTDAQLVFLGDSRMRQIYQRASSLIDSKGALTHVSKDHENHDHASGKLAMRWATKPAELADYFKALETPPQFILMGSGLWTMKNVPGDDGVKEFRHQMDDLAVELSKFGESHPETALIWMMIEDTRESDLRDDRKVLSVENIKIYNEIAAEALKPFPAVQIFSKNRLISSLDEIGLSNDGLHYINDQVFVDSDGFSAALNEIVVLILNAFCNSKMRPSDASCCVAAEKLNSVQYLMAILTIAAGTAFLIYQKREREAKQGYEALEQDAEAAVPAQKPAGPPAHIEMLWNVVKFMLIMYYFWLCDRNTSFAFKANKHYSFIIFLIGLAAILISCIAFGGCTTLPKAGFLNREQTGEWKGWMQLVILLYHISGASAHVPVYMHIRVLVGAYLFQTGYGHTCYAFFKGDYSFSRVIKTMFRLNFLTIPLCWVMNRPFQFYYFIPLCAFWFTLYYAWLSVPVLRVEKLTPETQAVGLRNMMIKLSSFVVVTAVIFWSPDLFQKVFTIWPLRPIFELPGGSGKLYEWWFRAQLDRFAVPAGSLTAILYFYGKYKNLIDESISDGKKFICDTKIAKVLIGVSAVYMAGYSVHLANCSDKKFCNAIHVYASGLYILAFVALRNVPDYMRARYSHRFAWFGNISLELFIGQYHIWLAQDTKGMLIFFPTLPLWVNLIFTTVSFVCIAHEIHDITEVLARHCLPKDEKQLYIRTVVFSIIVVILSDDVRALVGL